MPHRKSDARAYEASPIARALRAVVMAYQWALSPYLGARCRFVPSCSEYALDALALMPWPRALAAIAWRIVRCGPWSHRGVDLAQDAMATGPAHKKTGTMRAT